MLVWLTLPFHDFCGFRSVAVNSVFTTVFTFIFAILLPVLSRLIMSINTTLFDFSRWRPTPSWIFEYFKFLTVRAEKRVELRHLAKFPRNRSNRGRDMAIFQFFQDGGRPTSWICNACVGTTHARRAFGGL